MRIEHCCWSDSGVNEWRGTMSLSFYYLKGSDCGAYLPKVKKQAENSVDQETLMTKRQGLPK